MRGVVVRGSKGAYVWDFGNREYGSTRLQGTIALERQSDAYGYGLTIDATRFFNSAYAYGAAKKNWAIYIGGTKDATSISTGDSNDAYLRISGNNYAPNDANFIYRGINVGINNRSGGVANMDNCIGIQNKSGGTCASMIGLTITSENYGTASTTFGVLDLVLRNEGAVATTEFGMRIRNTNVSLGTAVDAAIIVSNTATNIGFTTLFDLSDCDLVAAGNDVTIMTFKDAAGTAKKLIYTIGDVVLDVGAA
jgi:hypothetical protein